MLPYSISFIGGIVNLTGNNSFSGGLGIFNDGTINAAGLPNTTTLRFTHDGNLGAAGAGITRLAAFVAEPYLRDGRLQAVFGPASDWQPEPMEVFFCVSDRRDFTAKIRALFEHLQAGIAPAWQV